MLSKTIVFIHGMYMNQLCWEKWVDRFEGKGFKCIAPAWPGRDLQPDILRERHPDLKLGELTLGMVFEHFSKVISGLNEKPILIGHSMGGLITQMLLQGDLAVAGVAIDSAPPRGVFTTKWPFLKANWPHITPFISQSSPIEMSFERFQYAFVNTMPLLEQREAYDKYVVPESRRVPREALSVRLDYIKPHPPLLFIAGSADHLIPPSLTKANFVKYQTSPSVTSFKEFPGRVHFIIGQNGWEEVADYVGSWLTNQ